MADFFQSTKYKVQSTANAVWQRHTTSIELCILKTEL